MYWIRLQTFNPFYLLKLIRDGDLKNSKALERAFSRPGSSHLVGSTSRSLELFQELGIITIDEYGDITPTPKLQRLLEAFNLGLSRMAAWGSDALVVKPLFGLPQPSSRDADIFVLMPFKESLRPVYEDHMRNLAMQHKYVMARADDLFSAGSLMSDIWNAMNAARVIVADCTGQNPNVFYEIGMAHTLGKTVILISQRLDDIPADLRGFKIILYEHSLRGMEEFEDRLSKTLQAELRKPQPLESGIRDTL